MFGAIVVSLVAAESAGGWFSDAWAQDADAGPVPDPGLTVVIGADKMAGAPAAESIRLYNNSHALVIGIDEYTNGWPRLSNAVSDARAVAAVRSSVAGT